MQATDVSESSDQLGEQGFERFGFVLARVLDELGADWIRRGEVEHGEAIRGYGRRVRDLAAVRRARAVVIGSGEHAGLTLGQILTEPNGARWIDWLSRRAADPYLRGSAIVLLEYIGVERDVERAMLEDDLQAWLAVSGLEAT
jgi:hypothetical protein